MSTFNPQAPQMDMGDPFDRARSTNQKVLAELTENVVMSPLDMQALVGAYAISGHVLLEANFGTGKTTIAKTMGGATSGTFERIQGTPDVMASDITGGRIYNQATQKFEFLRGPIFANVVLVDEIQRMAEKPQAGLTQAMEEGAATPAGGRETYDLPKPQLVIATRNADGFVAPNILDRFKVGIKLPDQDAAMRKAVVAKKKTGHQLQAVVSPQEIVELQQATRGIAIAAEYEDQANGLIDRVHGHEAIDHEDTIQGGSRSLLNILDLARYAALTRGNRNVDATDVAFGAYYVLPHRLAVEYKAEEAGMTPHKIVHQTINQQLAGV